MSRHTGYLKFFIPKKEYGFIKSNSADRDIFFHWKDIETQIEKEELGNMDRSKVTFELTEVPNGFEARKIEVDVSGARDLIRGIKAWEAIDFDGNVVHFEMDEYEEVSSLNLSKNLKIEFKAAGDRVVARVTKKTEDDIMFEQK